MIRFRAAALLLVPLSLLTLLPDAHSAMVAVPPAPPGAAEFMAKRNLIWAVAQFLSLAVPLMFLLSGWGSALSTYCTRIAGGRRTRGLVLFAITYLVFNALILLPFDYYRECLSLGNMGDPLSQWAIGESLALAERIVAVGLFVWIPYWLMVRTPKAWWLLTAVILSPVAALALVVVPVWMRPMTGQYQTLRDPAFAREISALAARCGVRDVPVLVGGNETTVVGLGATSRIILGENLLSHQTPAQIRFTVGHELKHYVLHDELKGLLIIIALLFAGFFLCDRIGRAVIRRHGQRLGFYALSDPASFPLLILSFTALVLCVLPLFNWYARHIEFEADRFGLELTHENQAMAEAEAAYITGGDSPEWDTFFMLFRATHPSDADRIRFANSYHPWADGKPLVYGNICPRS